MTIRNPFRKEPEKKAAKPVRPTPPDGSYSYPPVADPAVYTPPPPARTDDCGTGSSSGHTSTPHGHSSSHGGHSYESGGHSGHTSFDHGSHSFGGHDSGSSGCDSGGGF